MPSADPLHQLRDLERSALEFPNHLTRLVDGKEYRDRIATLQHEDVVWLIECLDTVRPASPRSTPSYPTKLRYSAPFNLPIRRFGNVSKNSERYAVHGGRCRSRASSSILHQQSRNGRSPRGGPAIRTRDALGIPGFLLSGYGCIPMTSKKRANVYVVNYAILFRSRLTESSGIL